MVKISTHQGIRKPASGLCVCYCYRTSTQLTRQTTCTRQNLRCGTAKNAPTKRSPEIDYIVARTSLVNRPYTNEENHEHQERNNGVIKDDVSKQRQPSTSSTARHAEILRPGKSRNTASSRFQCQECLCHTYPLPCKSCRPCYRRSYDERLEDCAAQERCVELLHKLRDEPIVAPACTHQSKFTSSSDRARRGIIRASNPAVLS